jgi:hypothetical protein
VSVPQKKNVHPFLLLIYAFVDINLRAKSFRLFCEKFTPESAVRTALTPYRKEEWLTNIPLYGI